jgi:hypothetical protein
MAGLLISRRGLAGFTAAAIVVALHRSAEAKTLVSRSGQPPSVRRWLPDITASRACGFVDASTQVAAFSRQRRGWRSDQSWRRSTGGSIHRMGQLNVGIAMSESDEVRKEAA